MQVNDEVHGQPDAAEPRYDLLTLAVVLAILIGSIAFAGRLMMVDREAPELVAQQAAHVQVLVASNPRYALVQVGTMDSGTITVGGIVPSRADERQLHDLLKSANLSAPVRYNVRVQPFSTPMQPPIRRAPTTAPARIVR